MLTSTRLNLDMQVELDGPDILSYRNLLRIRITIRTFAHPKIVAEHQVPYHDFVRDPDRYLVKVAAHAMACLTEELVVPMVTDQITDASVQREGAFVADDPFTLGKWWKP